ncbi:DUF6786 family protein [Ulvibacterium sp.]|uniref:DUF6786 family protein n=1 Tax=Ulvibacterium sp. TaxID=2665914 RepID=UPI0026319A56|nr:DUF6786 family protein [Ulvibacterium sp.]
MDVRTKKYGNHFLIFGLVFMGIACKEKPKGNTLKEKSGQTSVARIDALNSYESDVSFLREYMEIIELSDANGSGRVAVSPVLQGRVMTSTTKSEDGQSFGWLNYQLIQSGEVKEHFNPVGGEERFWLGPEGGQFSIYFKPGTSFEFKNWYVPKELDTEPFEVTEKSGNQVSFKKRMSLLNYSGNTFDLTIDRTVRLINKDKVANVFGFTLEEGIEMVGFETENKLTNVGDSAWNEKTGMLSIWILSMLNPSENTYVILPFKKGSESDLDKVLTDYRFSGDQIPTDRLSILEDKGVVLFKADGQNRGKIGISQRRALPMAASYDAKNAVLTLAYFSLPKEERGYVNSLWEFQDKPFAGDAVNSYNDGPLEDGTQLGPFYEIESSSPAAELGKNESLIHIHGTIHLQAEKDKLEKITKELFDLRLSEIKI